MGRAGGRGRLLVAVAFGAYLLALVFMLLVPFGEVPGEGLNRLALIAQDLGAPDALLTPTRFEFIANVLVFVPVTAVLSWFFPGVRWSDWAAYGFIGSFGVEAVQAVVLPERSAVFSDVVANTAGSLIGAVIAAVYLRWRRTGRPLASTQ